VLNTVGSQFKTTITQTVTQEIKMFNLFAHGTIDAVQSFKKEAVKLTVLNKDIAADLNKFVDTQTEYTKQAVDNFTGIAVSIAKVATDPKNFKFGAK
jgi:CO dehydrogenase/acetyl-CoA synthase delta subunit